MEVIKEYLSKYFGDALTKYKTPFFVYSESRIIDNITLFRNALDMYFPNAYIYYGLKSCYLKRVVETIVQEAGHVDIQSEMEYSLISKLSAKVKGILYNSPCKTYAVMDAISRNRGIVIADSIEELDYMLNHCYSTVGIRIQPVRPRSTDKMFISSRDRFGIPLSVDLITKINSIPSSIKVVLHMHALSRLCDIHMIYDTFQNTIEEIKKISREIVIDFGGGFDTNLRLNISISELIFHYMQLIKDLDQVSTVLFEPGRYITEDSAVAVATVNRVKRTTNDTWLMTDIGTNILVPVTAARFEVSDVYGESGTGKAYSVADATCSPAGVIQRQVLLPHIHEGDRIVIRSCGAYTYSLSETFCNKIPTAYFLDKSGNTKTMISEQATESIKNLIFGA